MARYDCDECGRFGQVRRFGEKKIECPARGCDNTLKWDEDEMRWS